MNAFLKILKTIITFPISWMPVKWQGHRRSILATLVTVAVSLQGLDLVSITDSICAIWLAIFKTPCNLSALAGTATVYLALLLEALKSDTESSVFTAYKKPQE